jgi:hypothetical protein
MVQSVRNYAHNVNRGLEKEFVVCSRSETSDDPGDDYFNRSRFVPPCHCEERSDVAIQRSHPTPLSLSLRGAQATRQSSGTIGQLPHRPAPRITTQTGLPRSTGLAMTALGDAFENRNEPPRSFAPHTLSLRGRRQPRRVNPAVASHSAQFVIARSASDAAIQREHRVITASVRHPAQRSGLDCHALTGSQ